jgi:hypothetical protein
MSLQLSRQKIIEYYGMVDALQKVLLFMETTHDQILLKMWANFLKKYFPDTAEQQQKQPPSTSVTSAEQRATYTMIYEKLKSISADLNMAEPKEINDDIEFSRLKSDVIPTMLATLGPICIYAHAPIYQDAWGMLTYWNHKMGGTTSNIAFMTGVLCGLGALAIAVCHKELDFLNSDTALSITLPMIVISLACFFASFKYHDKKLIAYADNYDKVPRGLHFQDERNQAEQQEGKLETKECLSRISLRNVSIL